MAHIILHLVVNTSILLLLVIPLVVSFRFYQKTHIHDFLLLSFLFLFSMVGILFYIISLTNSELIVWQIQHFLASFPMLILLVHTTRVRKQASRSNFAWLGYIWFLGMCLIILLWKSSIQPDRADVLFWDLEYNSNYAGPVHPNGAGFNIGNTIIYSTSYPLLQTIFRLYVSTVFCITYIRIELIQPTKRTRVGKVLWILAGLFLILFDLGVHVLGSNSVILLSLPLMATLLISYISIRIPEGVLLSSTQVIRALSVISSTELLEKSRNHEGIKTIKDYLDALPKE